MFEGYTYWIVYYTSCEGNDRWTIVRTPDTWDRDNVISAIPIGGCGDDIAEIVSVDETGDFLDYRIDLT